MKILYLCPRIPFPPIKGDKLRAYYQIVELSKRHEMTLVTFVEEGESTDNLRILYQFCERVVAVNHRKNVGLRSAFRHLLDSLPLQCGYYDSGEMKNKLFQILTSERYDILHVQLARMIQYVASIRAITRNIPAVVDFVDALSLNMKKRMERENLTAKPFFFYEWLKMKNHEKRLGDYFDAAMISSPVDRIALPYSARLRVLPNGVDLDYFRYRDEFQREPNTIIFTGNMGYFPNIDAVMYFARHCFPEIKKAIPRVRFKVIGNCPANVRTRISARFKEVELVGYVQDMNEHLSKATIAIAPMQSGSGIQNKVLEAMATGTPLVATKLATQAIEAHHYKDLLVADGPSDFTKAVVKLLSDSSLRRRLGINGRRLVEKKYSWRSVGLSLESIYEEAIENFFKKYEGTSSCA